MSVRLRTAVAVGLVSALALGGAAQAAPKKAKPKPVPPTCNLIVDPAGDDGSEVFQHSQSLDLLGADIASSAKLVTAVLRVAKLTKSDSAAAPTGRAWYLEFSVANGQAPLWLGAQSTPSGELFRYGWVDGSIRRSLGTAEGAFDEAKNEIRITAPVDVWADRGSVKAGTKVTGLAAASYNFLGVAAVGGSLQPGDTAETSKMYQAGAPSCVVVGK